MGPWPFRPQALQASARVYRTILVLVPVSSMKTSRCGLTPHPRLTLGDPFTPRCRYVRAILFRCQQCFFYNDSRCAGTSATAWPASIRTPFARQFLGKFRHGDVGLLRPSVVPGSPVADRAWNTASRLPVWVHSCLWPGTQPPASPQRTPRHQNGPQPRGTSDRHPRTAQPGAANPENKPWSSRITSRQESEPPSPAAPESFRFSSERTML